MKFIGYYGCGMGDNEIALEAKDYQSALNYCYEMAIEDRQSYVGLHGILEWHEVAEDNGYDPFTNDDKILEQIDFLYNEQIESDISYSVIEFDPKNESHADILENQEGVFWEV